MQIFVKHHAPHNVHTAELCSQKTGLRLCKLSTHCTERAGSVQTMTEIMHIISLLEVLHLLMNRRRTPVVVVFFFACLKDYSKSVTSSL